MTDQLNPRVVIPNPHLQTEDWNPVVKFALPQCPHCNPDDPEPYCGCPVCHQGGEE